MIIGERVDALNCNLNDIETVVETICDGMNPYLTIDDVLHID